MIFFNYAIFEVRFLRLLLGIHIVEKLIKRALNGKYELNNTKILPLDHSKAKNRRGGGGERREKYYSCSIIENVIDVAPCATSSNVKLS